MYIEFKLVSSMDCDELDFIVAHHYFNTVGHQVPIPLACADLASQLNCLIYMNYYQDMADHSQLASYGPLLTF